MSAIDELRKRFSKASDKHLPWVKVPLEVVPALSKTHFDVVSKGVEGGVALVTDLRLKFGPHSGKSLLDMAANPADRMYIRKLYTGFTAVPSATLVVRQLIEKLLDETEVTIRSKLAAVEAEAERS